MERWNELRAAVVKHTPAEPRDCLIARKERPYCKRTKRHNHFGPNRVNLTEQEGLARADLVRFWIPILWWTTLDDVRNIHVVTRQIDRLDDLRQQLPGAANERNPLAIFVPAGRFTNEHQVCVGIAHAEDKGCPCCMQLTSRTLAQLVPKLSKSFAPPTRTIPVRRRSTLCHLSSGIFPRYCVPTVILRETRFIAACPPRAVSANPSDAKFLEEGQVTLKLVSSSHGLFRASNSTRTTVYRRQVPRPRRRGAVRGAPG